MRVSTINVLVFLLVLSSLQCQRQLLKVALIRLVYRAKFPVFAAVIAVPVGMLLALKRDFFSIFFVVVNTAAFAFLGWWF